MVEVTLSRSSSGQLGFHVNRNAVITDIEPRSPADLAGLKPSSRLVRICGSDVVAMTHEHMVDLLRSSASVVLTVVQHLGDGKSRRSVHLERARVPYQNGSGLFR